MIGCQACGHQNPLGRVFCQKCGTKLDLSKVRAPGIGGGEPGSNVTIGVKKDDGKKGKNALKTAIRIFDVLLIVALVAVIALVWQEPPVPSISDSPSMADKVKLEREKLEFAISVKRAYKLSISDVALNSYLAAVSDIDKVEESGVFRTDKTVLVPQQDLVNVVSIRRVVVGSWQKQIVLQYLGRPVVDGGEFRMQAVSGTIGKLPVPGFLMGPYERNFARLFQNFSKEQELLGKLAQIQVEDKKVTLQYEAPQPK
jgi:hypothetical protein